MGFELFSFPFYQIGWVLRRLSLSGTAGNAAATALYLVICLLPVIWLFFRSLRLRRRPRPVDLWLPVISAGLFLVIYVMINPGCLPDSMTLMEGSDLCVCLWSAIIVWLVMKVLGIIRDGDEAGLLGYLQKGILAFAVILVLSVPAGIFTQLQPQLQALQAGNTDPLVSVADVWGIGNPLKPSIAFLWFKYLMDCIPTLALLPVLRKGYALTKALGQDKYGAETVTAADALCRTCLGVVPVMVVEPLVMNLVQLAGKGLRSLSFRLSFPVIEIMLVICVFLLAKFFASARELKEDNQMII